MVDILPSELLDLISSYCDHASQKSLRHVCRIFHDAATPQVFDNFYTAMFDDCLNNLCRLAKSRLAKNVMKFTFYADVLPKWNRAAWEENVVHYPETPWYHHSYDASRPISEWTRPNQSSVDEHCCPFSEPSRMNIAWDEFQSLRREQRKWCGDATRLIFMEGFAMLPNLMEVSISTTKSFQGPTSQWPVWKRLQERMLVSPDDWICMSKYSKEMSRSRVCRHGTLILMEAIGSRSSFAGTRRIDRLSLHYSHIGALGVGAFADQAWQPGLQDRKRAELIEEVFSDLSELSLRVPPHPASDIYDDSAASTASEIAGFLSRAQRLRRLELDYGSGFFLLDASSRDDVAKRLLGATFSPHIAHLSLNLDVSHMDLLDLLKQLSLTLPSLELRDMIVADVPALLLHMPKVVELRHVYVEKLWHETIDPDRGHEDAYIRLLSGGTDVQEPLELAVKSYLLGKRNELPMFKSRTTGQPLPTKVLHDQNYAYLDIASRTLLS